MKRFIPVLILLQSVISLHALVINEVMSNPVGDDSGREWIEVYNNTDIDVDIATLTVSIKGGSFVPVTPVSGGTIIKAHGYGILGSTFSGTTRFMQDYTSYSGPLFKSTISLVNTGITSMEIKLGGTSVDTLPSYTAAKEGSTLSIIKGSFITTSPSPGSENVPTSIEEDTPTTTTQTGSQMQLPQTSPPLADITLYLPDEKLVVAGAPALFSVFSSTRSGKMIDSMVYTWAFGDGGQSTGSTTLYRYLYPGRYITQVEGTNGLIAGTGRMMIRVVSPDIALSPVGVGKYGPYIDITNPNTYDLDLSLWKITIDGAIFTFPKNTLLTIGTTRFPGSALGFASTTVTSNTIIKLLFPNMEEAVRVLQETTPDNPPAPHSIASSTIVNIKFQNKQYKIMTNLVRTQPASTSFATTSTPSKNNKKDTRLATFIKSFFGK